VSPDQNDGDYEYDQAHDLENGQVPAPSPGRLEHPSPSSKVPAVEPDGDYSYDQAHDAGRR
jgi:hypothetical protein